MKEIKCEAEGKISFKQIKYAGEIITFKKGQELKIEYLKYAGEDFIAVVYDFGMVIKESCNKTGFCGINENTSIKEIVRKSVQYDVEHAFCHPDCDPNYTELHWAIKGWLKDRVIITENTNFYPLLCNQK